MGKGRKLTLKEAGVVPHLNSSSVTNQTAIFAASVSAKNIYDIVLRFTIQVRSLRFGSKASLKEWILSQVGMTKKILLAFEKCGANNSMSDNVKNWSCLTSFFR